MKKKAKSGEEGEATKPKRLSGPEEAVRQNAISELKRLGWPENRLQWKPEWSVPDTPHDLTKRERKQKFATCGNCDLVAFADESGEPHALQVIFEFKEPTIEAGRHQLMRYLASEPVVRMGYWTNGTSSLAIYKSHTNDWIEVVGAPLPHPGDDLTMPPKTPPTWKDLRIPTASELTAALNRIVNTVVVRDSHTTRREDQLRELLHTLLVKVESDNQASIASHQTRPVQFRIYGDRTSMVAVTAKAIQEQFKAYFTKQQTRVFHPDDVDHIRLSDEVIFAVVDMLAPWRILGDSVDLLSKAFQVFRTRAMKSGEGQFLTPQRVIRPCVLAMEIASSDKVIDPACGSGGFLIEALRQVQERDFPNAADTWRLVKFANDNLYGVDKDALGAKLTKALMIAMQDGSTHVLIGDSIRRNLWKSKFPQLEKELGRPGADIAIAEQFTVVITNPPFGENLKVSAADARASGFTITRAASDGSRAGNAEHVDLEIGLLYLELAHRLLQTGGRVGIILPETYFFSYKYRWLPEWLEGRLELRGMLNIAMEAFEEFCRAKTNFYIFEKVGNGPSTDAVDAKTRSKPRKSK
jgi:type I restriction enzyme M protein